MPAVNYDWDDVEDNIVEEYDDAGVTVAEYTTEPGLYGNVISQNRSGVESQFHFDALGSTLVFTDNNQQVTDTRAYSAFGETTESTGSIGCPFQYVGANGYYRHTNIGAYMARRRPYEPIRARWSTIDPQFPTASAHPYTYANNSPNNVVDPSGLLSCDIEPQSLILQQCAAAITCSIFCPFVKVGEIYIACAPGFLVAALGVHARLAEETCCRLPIPDWAKHGCVVGLVRGSAQQIPFYIGLCTVW